MDWVQFILVFTMGVIAHAIYDEILIWYVSKHVDIRYIDLEEEEEDNEDNE